MRFNKDDIVILVLAVCLASAISIPIFFVIDVGTDKAEEKALADASNIEEKTTKLEEVPQKVVSEDKPKEEPKDEVKKDEVTTISKPVLESNVGKTYYRNTLNANEMAVYDLICSNISNFNEEYFSIPSISSESLLKIHKYIALDREDFFYFTTINYTTNGNDYSKRVKLVFNCSRQLKNERTQQINTIVDGLVSQMQNMTAYEKSKFAHDFVINNTDYVLNAPENQNLVSVFLGKKSVCAGYSRAYQYILRKAGVYCIYLTGTGNDSTITSNVPVGHAWNLVRLDDNKYYYVDVTFDDPTYEKEEINNYCGYDHLHITTAELLKNHTLPTDLPKFPDANSTTYNYFVKEGLFFSKFDNDTINTIKNKIQSNNEEKKIVFSFKFADSTTYGKAVNQLIQNGKQMNSILKSINSNKVKNQFVTNSYSYLMQDSKYIITFLLKYK